MFSKQPLLMLGCKQEALNSMLWWKGLRVSASNNFPVVVSLKLPTNIVDINAAEVGRFSPLRERDLSGPVITSYYKKFEVNQGIDITSQSKVDPHVNKYDCRGAVCLSSSMQSNVPSPFSGNHTHLSMPGSQWGQGYKYLSDHLHSAHYLTLRNEYREKMFKKIFAIFSECPTYYCQGLLTNYFLDDWTRLYLLNKFYELMRVGAHVRQGNTRVLLKFKIMIPILFLSIVAIIGTRTMCTQTNEPLSTKEKLKKAVTEYGSTVMVFHITISLISLGGCYLLVSSGVNIMSLLEYFNLEGKVSNLAAANAGTFVIAYAVHKVFAPVRIGITLTCTPFIVGYLRKIGFLKQNVGGGQK